MRKAQTGLILCQGYVPALKIMHGMMRLLQDHQLNVDRVNCSYTVGDNIDY